MGMCGSWLFLIGSLTRCSPVITLSTVVDGKFELSSSLCAMLYFIVVVIAC